jgi:subfamily B ATP-binding cassette protein HlyB/CyaB
MTQSSAAALLQHPAFTALSPEGVERLERGTRLLRYRIGQSLSEGAILPAQMLVILSGTARLLGREHGRLSTLARLEAGQVVGLVSILRGAACEEVSAAEELVAAAVDDSLILELYTKEDSFRLWCADQLWPAEIAALLSSIQQRSARSDISLLRWLKPALECARVVRPDRQDIDIAQNNQDLEVFLGCACRSWSIGMTIDLSLPIPKALSPFDLRLIGLPKALVATITRSEQENESSDGATDEPWQGTQSETSTTVIDAPVLPEASRLQADGLMAPSKFKLIRGEGPLQETLACFQMLAGQMELPFRRDSIEKVLRDSLRRGQNPNLQLCGQVAASLGLHVVGAQVPPSMCTRLQTPSLLNWGEGFAIVIGSSSAGIRLASPRTGMVELSPQQVTDLYPEGMEVLLIDRSNATPEHKFGPSWFWPALKRYRGVLAQVFAASFVVQLFSLANPLLIQVIIDKVITQRSLDTLQVLGIALVVVTLLEGVLGSLRTFLFTETTNRIDQRLGAEVIDHLLRLPLDYFDNRPVGELGSRIAELEKIRNFLTGQALTTILDAAFSVIYIVVMALYSWVLTIVALIVVPIQVGLTLLGAPLFRRQFRQAAEENARTQSHLVEVLTGIQTVKAQNVEMVSRWKWQELYSKYINRTFEKTITGTAVSETSQVLQKLSQLLVLWVGAGMVLRGEITLGQLIAFRIISGYVTQPLLRLSSIWQNIQELRVSFERLADVIDTPQESNQADQAKIPLPPLDGNVLFDDVTFSFKRGIPPALKSVSLDIQKGTFVGIVGQSGSGKSTLMKLLPRLYAPDSGRILIDNYDIDKVELYSLRRQIGIVPQDPLLFSGTVAENIALTHPDADSEEIVYAAKIACAHDFIMELPNGYSSNVGERGAGLSGGQRQRIAIARTLLSKPKLLVMDEATSALDYDTERRVCDNLVDALHDCTVFYITHRLSTIRRADLIVMMHQGAIVETGRHNELMDLKGRYYALYRQQESN